MNTRQKLTLGVAAIIIVMLTIVGVTYAYFVTRVDTQQAADVEVQTASIGSVKYVQGNGDGDIITLSDVEPGEIVYKTFSVKNTAEADTTGNYTVYLTSTTLPSTPHFVHGKTVTTCYDSKAKQSTAVDDEETEDVNEGATKACFDNTVYNNIKVTLYELTAEGKVVVDGKISDKGILDDSLITNAETNETVFDDEANAKIVFAESGAPALSGESNGTASLDLTPSIEITGGKETFYVLKVEYEDLDDNQNIENDAVLQLKASIK